ncbi:MAG: hypothetical protein JXA64_09570 [Candidatus Fermentibacteraceae bacterium]|nr:hypothetical protein [Candidatus Fermentibacteraceae bacterium]MBN2609348.1 hypothetical protein [Candidatus Fermentibacteraceae bacterium]
MKRFVALAILLMTACGPTQRIQEDYFQLTGSTQVMAVGTRSETVVFEDFQTGERYALVGDLARELVPQYGLPVSVTVIPTEEGWSIDPELQKMELLDYTILTTEEDYYE